jgi:hypothetical protein
MQSKNLENTYYLFPCRLKDQIAKLNQTAAPLNQKIFEQREKVKEDCLKVTILFYIFII